MSTQYSAPKIVALGSVESLTLEPVQKIGPSADMLVSAAIVVGTPTPLP